MYSDSETGEDILENYIQEFRPSEGKTHFSIAHNSGKNKKYSLRSTPEIKAHSIKYAEKYYNRGGDKEEEDIKKSLKGVKIYLRGELGEGSYGRIHYAEDSRSNAYAVKEIPVTDNCGLTLPIEISIMSVLKHPHLNSALSIRFNPGKIVIIQELALMDLGWWRHNYEPSTREIREICYSLVQAVKFLHGLGIIHSDIKANNVLIYRNGNIKLTDFGVSTLNRWSNKRKVCTSSHRPLEVWLNDPWDEKVDIWSLGCTIFYIMYGHGLFSTRFKGETAPNINAIIMWYRAKFGGKRPPNVRMSRCEFDPPRIPPEMRKYIDRNDLDDERDLRIHFLLQLLRIYPEDRASAEELLEHNYLSRINVNFYDSVYEYRVEQDFDRTRLKVLPPEVVDWIEEQDYDHQENHDDICELTVDLYFRISDLDLPEVAKAVACYALAYKMVRRLPLSYKLDRKIFKTEMKICEYLDYHLHTHP